jgi:hypothetical protein
VDHFNVQNCEWQWRRGEAINLRSHTKDPEMISVGLEVPGAVRASAVSGAGVRVWGLQRRYG